MVRLLPKVSKPAWTSILSVCATAAKKSRKPTTGVRLSLVHNVAEEVDALHPHAVHRHENLSL